MRHFFLTFISSMSDGEGVEQEQILEVAFQTWRGNLDQVDDILVTGIKFGE